MGGCRCLFRNCQSSSSLTPGLHYFHFPIRDNDRCEQWITNSRKPMLRNIPREKLRNKVICSLHFEEKCFTNEKHDRLVHNAIPTLGCEDAPEDYTSFANQIEIENNDNNIMLIPVNEDNTKFTLPDVSFSGMSYTIFDDALIPSSNIPLLMNQVENKPKISIIVKKNVEIEKQKRPKFAVKSINKILAPQVLKTIKQEKQDVKTDIETNNGNITSYSLSTYGDDVMVEISKQTKNSENDICTYSIDTSKSDAPLLDNEISLKLKGGNEYTMSVVTTPPPQNTNETPMEIIEEPVEILKPKNNEFNVTPEKEYIRMIKNNSKQIVELKKVVNKQNRLHRYLLQKKQLPKFKKRKCNKFKLLENLKEYVKPSLMAILKFEILSSEDVVLTDGEEKFITDLYTEDPECYNLLLKKYKWNLPNSDNFTEESGN